MRQRWRNGNILRIGLRDSVGYCQMIRHPFYAFFDIFAENNELNAVVERPVLFVVAVVDTAFKGGRWAIVGQCELRPALREPLLFYRQDRFTKSLSIVRENGLETVASLEDCSGLECAAVWDPEHVEARLEDHLMGRPNKWHLSMATVER